LAVCSVSLVVDVCAKKGVAQLDLSLQHL